MFGHLPATGQLVALKNADAELVVAPSCGARLVSFRASGRDILRPTSREALDSAFIYGFAAFPLMPYSGPIFGDGFRFCEEWHPLGRNVPTEPTATHGEAWIRPWTIVARADSELRLTMDYAPSADDFPLRLARRHHLWLGAGQPGHRLEGDQSRSPADASGAWHSSLFPQGAGHDADL